MSGHDVRSSYVFAEAESLRKSYDTAVGDALELKIPVHVNGRMKCLGDLRDEIRAARKVETR